MAQYGGALYIQEGTFYINDTQFEQNYGQQQGGCLLAQSMSRITIENTNFTVIIFFK